MGGKRNVVIIIIVCELAVGCAFALGEGLAQRSMLRESRVRMDGMQAMLLADRISEEEKIGHLLERGCTAQALQSLSYREDSDLRLLSEFMSRNLDDSAMGYIASQDPEVLRYLKTFKSKYGSAWREPECGSPVSM